MGSKIGFEKSLIIAEAIRGRCASFMSLPATVSEIFGGQTTPSILVVEIITNLSFTHYPFQPLSFSFPNFMAEHGVGVAQAKTACKHTIATRKCYQYTTFRCLCECI